MNKKLVIFDLDGTLTDSLASIWKTTNTVLEAFGLERYEKDPYRYFVGDGAATLVERAFAGRGVTDPQILQRAKERYRIEFEKYCMFEVVPYPGITDLIGYCKKKGILISVNSNKPHERTIEVIETVFGKGTFDYIVGQSSGREKKPSPDGVNYILKMAGVSKEETVYLGDTSTDMKTGHAAGVFTVGALWGFRDEKELREHQADALIEKPMELVKYL